MGSCPSPDVAGDHFAGNRKTNSHRSTHTELADPVASLQLRVGRFDPRADFVSVFPLRRLLVGIHLVPQPDLGSDLQTEVADRFARLAARIAMVGGSNRAFVQHPA